MTMVNTFGKKEEFVPYSQMDNGIYRIAWARQDEPAEEGQEPSLCTYTLEHYTYKPSMGIVIDDIMKSCRPASMQELKAIAEGLGDDPLPSMQAALLLYSEAYDSSEAVNSFLLDGQPAWLDKATRVGLMNSTTIAQASGRETTTVWFSGRRIEMPCHVAIAMLSSLEMYALECFNRTAAHQAAIAALDSVEAALEYDYKDGYPERLSFNV